jgi:hypothetical protein
MSALPGSKVSCRVPIPDAPSAIPTTAEQTGGWAVCFSLSHKAVWRTGWEILERRYGCETTDLVILESWLSGVGR